MLDLTANVTQSTIGLNGVLGSIAVCGSMCCDESILNLCGPINKLVFKTKVTQRMNFTAIFSNTIKVLLATKDTLVLHKHPRGNMKGSLIMTEVS